MNTQYKHNKTFQICTASFVMCWITSAITPHASMAQQLPTEQTKPQARQLSAQEYLALRNDMDGTWREDDVTIIGVGPCPDGRTLVTMKSETKPDVFYYPKLLDEKSAPHIGLKYRVLLSMPSLGLCDLLCYAVPTDVATLEQQITVHGAEAQAAKKKAGSTTKAVQRPSSKLASRFGNASYMPVYPAYLKAIQGFNPRLNGDQAELITHSLLSYSQQFGVDPRLVVAMILAESRFRPDAVSRVGATGLGQLMPRTASGLGVGNPLDPRQNLYGSIKLLRGHLGNYAAKVGAKGTASWQHIVLTMAAYNAGAGAVRKYGGVPPYKETRAHVTKVTNFYRQLCAGD